MTEKYRVHDLAKFHYSEIGEYIDKNHTDRPLRNDILVNLLNELSEENEQLKQELCQQEMEYATEHHHLAEENEQLKNKIKLILEKKYHKFVNGEIDDFKIEDLEQALKELNECED